MVLLCMNFLVLFEILGALERFLAYLARNEHKGNGEKKGKNNIEPRRHAASAECGLGRVLDLITIRDRNGIPRR
jgi:hypothetical protein